MAKRRLCRDKLPHHEHLWGTDPNGMQNFLRVPTGTRGRARAVAQSYWCPGVQPVEQERK